ncbi:MAG TPA: YfhO family protein [Thermoanaerobaculia bacterium]|nr:YfhO family protein [Thermoanaerobaculia bacterium]
MFLLVLRLLAVYFATCALALFLVNRFVARIRPGIALLISFGPFLLTGRAMLTAGVYAPLDIAYQAHPLAAHREEMGIKDTRSPILGDVVSQFIPFRKAVRDAIKNGRLPLWNRFVLAGEPLLANTQPAVLHPGTVIGFLLPLAQAWTFEMSLRHFLALLAMYLFLRDLGCRELPSLLGAVGWCFSDYLVFFAGWQHSAAAPPFPLLLLGLSRLVREPGYRSVVLTVAAIFLIVTAGHPETLLHAVAAAGVYFLFQLAFAGPGRRRRPLLLSLLAGAVALGFSAVLLLPLVEALPYTAEHFVRSGWYAHLDKSVSLAESLRRSIADVVPYAFGVSGHGRGAIGFGEPAAYVGAVLLPFAVVGLFSRRREKWAIAAITFVGLAMWARLPIVTDLVSSLPLFDIGLNERMVFLAAFGISALAGLGAERVLEKSDAWALVAVIATIIAIFALYHEVRPTLLRLEMPETFLRGRLLAGLVPLVLLAGALAISLERKRTAPVLAFALLLLVVERGIEAGRLYPTFPNRAFYPPLRVLDPIPRAAPYRFTAVGFTFVPNISALYDLEDVRGYEAMTFQALTETFPLWCVPQPIWFNRVDDPTTPFLSFLNVRWVLVPAGSTVPPGWRTLSEGDGTRLVENPRALERAFVPRFLRRETTTEAQRDAVFSITDFAERGVVAADRAADWAPNGVASVRIETYRAQRLELAVDARSDAVVGTSIPAWPGWKLEIDGRGAPLVAYNRAFLGFAVPQGRYHVVLRYLPDGFVRGAAISGVTVLACVIAHLARRRRARRAR